MNTKLLFRVHLVSVAMLLLLALLFTPRSVPAQDPAPGAKGLAAAVQPFVERKAVAGAILLVADRDKTLGIEAVGSADIAGMRKMLTDALFWIASMTKPITAAALMMLVDDGKVNLDDPVEKYLPEFKGQLVRDEKDPTKLHQPKRPITVRDVLSHTSGLPFKTSVEAPTIDVLPLKDAVASYARTPLVSEPGTKYQYSNAGINTAGRIIEVVSGMPYEDFLQKRLFGPLGMKDTTFWPSEEQLKRLAKAYKPAKDKKGLEETTIGALKYPLSDRKGRYPVPGGGLFSTAEDCGHFCQMLLGGGVYQGKRLLSESAVRELSKKQTAEGLPSYGLGFAVGAESFGHGGAYATNMSIDTKRGLVTVYMVQHAGFPADGAKALGVFRKAAEDRFGKK